MKCIVLTGSPPPMRGKDTLRTCDCAAIGITPAYAGKSLFCTCIQMCSEDHPRLCGEKSMVEAILCFLSGSPPPMRGKDQPAPRQPCLFRITPAYAGKSHVFVRYEMFYRDHPRLCGEKMDFFAVAALYPGSPPPMRGKANSGFPVINRYGITPAYAGKSRSSHICRHESQDHPRLCGEKFSESLQTLVMIGSPPPMRGKVVETLDKALDGGITPAYAGKRSTPALW